MKKIQLLFLLLVTLTTSITFTSCKKDEEPSNQTLLVKKWYYKSFVRQGYSTTAFYADDYWEFKADGTFEETWDWGNGNYTLTNNQNTISITFPPGDAALRALAETVSNPKFPGVKAEAAVAITYQFSITKLTATELEFTYTSGDNLQTYKFSTTPNPERVRAK
ncbi:hypothetical protein [Pedobacter glucosidilyticus]|uniref:hypothetical protein n=1 Tax=Pedobacter glucosidilyticus TaxID=1122941 RepID=UPI0026EAFD0B|nr:hypothetical protein [Pedobacter glucosidilyticus]